MEKQKIERVLSKEAWHAGKRDNASKYEEKSAKTPANRCRKMHLIRNSVEPFRDLRKEAKRLPINARAFEEQIWLSVQQKSKSRNFFFMVH